MTNSRDTTQIFLVALEAGARWPAQLDCQGRSDVHVVVQQPDESGLAFVARLCVKLSQAEREGARLHAASLFLGQRFSLAQLALRCQVARLLARALTQAGGQQLTIRGNTDAPAWSDHVRALATAIEDETQGRLELSIGLSWPTRTRESEGSGTYSTLGQPSNLSRAG